ncbi:hypothetical protein EMIT051CA3_70280 [Pseudomonas chlororaphis]
MLLTVNTLQKQGAWVRPGQERPGGLAFDTVLGSCRCCLLGFVRKVGERRSGKAKTGEERPGSRSTLGAYMSIPSLFLTQHGLRSAEGAQRAATFRTEPRSVECHFAVSVAGLKATALIALQQSTFLLGNG